MADEAEHGVSGFLASDGEGAAGWQRCSVVVDADAKDGHGWRIEVCINLNNSIFFLVNLSTISTESPKRKAEKTPEKRA